jgi:hypothetical protein
MPDAGRGVAERRAGSGVYAVSWYVGYLNLSNLNQYLLSELGLGEGVEEGDGDEERGALCVHTCCVYVDVY